MRNSPPYLAALLTLAAASWPSSARVQDAPVADEFTEYRAQFHGTWRLAVSRDEGRRVVERAIEQTVHAMNFFVRNIARDQLRDNTPINRRIDLLFIENQRITVRFDDRHSYTTRVGRTHRFTTPEGDSMRVTQRFRDGVLEQVFATDQGTRWNAYSIQPDGHMRVVATTQGMMMPQPMSFALDYDRAAGD